LECTLTNELAMSFDSRPATESDAAAIASIHAASFRAAMPYLPVLHTAAEDQEFFRNVLAHEQVWVAGHLGEVKGFIAFTHDWVNHLYIHPEFQGMGAGSWLLEKAKESSGGRLDLWAFQRNAAARRFYERRGFRLVRLTDGSANEEKEPDVLYRWNRSE
jgi:GNAT superfamily N-acetyltransferase